MLFDEMRVCVNDLLRVITDLPPADNESDAIMITAPRHQVLILYTTAILFCIA